MDRTLAFMTLCRDLFDSNAIASDFDDIQVFRVTGRNFPQHPGGDGIHISFSVSGHMLGKTGDKAHEALGVLFPDTESEPLIKRI